MSRRIAVFWFRNDKRPPSGGWGKNAMISNHVKPRRRKRGEFLDQLKGLEYDVSGAIAPAVLEAIE